MEDDYNSTAFDQGERKERVPRIPLAKIAAINQDSKIAIFYSANRKSGMQVLDSSFPKEAAMVFCDRIRHELLDNPTTKAFTITTEDVEAYKDVLTWIKDSVVEEKPAEFKTLDEDSADCIKLYAQRILAAAYLGIPARDFAEALSKRMLKMARDKLMSWEDVETFYSDELYLKYDLSKIAGTSVFSAWWRAELDSDETPDQMSILADLRDDYPQLDQGLHDLVEDKREFMDKKREERRMKKAEEDAAGATGEDGGFSIDNNTTTGDGGWGASKSDAQPTGDWDSGGAAGWASTNEPNLGGKENIIPNTTTESFNPAGGFEKNGDWADEVNQTDTDYHTGQHSYPEQDATWSASAPTPQW